MRHHTAFARRAAAAVLICAAPLGAQRLPVPSLYLCGGCLLPPVPSTPALQPARIAGEAAAGVVGFTLGAETGLLAAAGIAYLVRGHGGDIESPGLKRMATAVLVAGGGAGAGTSAWLVSRIDRQSSSLGWDIGAATAATALAFAWADWPMDRSKPQRKMSRFRRMTPVWAGAVAATIAASSTRRRR